MEQPQMVNFGNVLSQGCFESRQGGRPENQDFAICCETLSGTLMVVCDGMGGGPGGKTASSEAGKVIAEFVKNAQMPDARDKQNVLQKAIQAANTHLRQLQLQYPQLQGMGTTCVCLLYDKYSAVSAHVGDSRIYQLRFKQKHWRSWDHSVSLDRIRDEYGKTEGHDIELEVERARTSPYNNVISRALGVADEVKVETHELPYERGDRFALCTDGIWGSMPERDLIKHFCHTTELGGALCWTMDSVQEIGVSEGNHHDNYTLALIDFKNDSKLKGKMTRKAIITIMALVLICVISIVCNCIQSCSNKEKISLIEQLRNEKVDINIDSLITIENNCNQKIAELRDSILSLQEDNTSKNKQAITMINPTKESSFEPENNAEQDSKEKEKIIKEIDEVLVFLKKCSSMSEQDKVKEKELDKNIKKLKNLKSSFSKDDKYTQLCNDLQKTVIDPLDNKGISIIRQSPKGNTRKSHYETLINRLEQIKSKIQ